jgi:AcrR family transcriptional regulator
MKRVRRKDARPGEVLEAALEVFAEKGFAMTRMEDVAARAGVSKGTVYLYYPSKEALFEAMVRAAILPNLTRLESLAAGYDGPALDLLHRFFAVLLQVLETPRLIAIPRLVIAEARTFPELALFYRREVVDRGLALIEGILRRGVERGELRPVDPAATARLCVAPFLLAAIWKATFDPLQDAKPLDARGLLDTHLATLTHALAAQTPDA